MSAFLSRLAVTLIGLPIVLGAAWLGGWPMLALIAVATLVALHELFRATRPLRPLTLAGFAGGLGALLALQLGGTAWLPLGLLVALVAGFVMAVLADTSQSNTAAVAVTIFGVVWIAMGLGYLLLIREYAFNPGATDPDKGRLAVFTVLLAVFAIDTAAYLVGRVAGKRKLAPRVSPGKTWEGFIGGAVAGIFVTWIALYRTGYVEGWRSIVLGAAIVLAATAGDLLESMVKRDVGVKDTGKLLAGHGGVLDRIVSLLLAAPVAYFVLLALDGIET